MSILLVVSLNSCSDSSNTIDEVFIPGPEIDTLAPAMWMTAAGKEEIAQ